MDENTLRAMIRDAVARLLGATVDGPAAHVAMPAARDSQPAAFAVHPSHYQYVTLVNIGDSCVIEPGVTCNHCGYCKTHGH